MHNIRTIVSPAITIKQGSDKNLCSHQLGKRFGCDRQTGKHVLPEFTVIHSVT